MAKKHVFVSFDFTNDKQYKYLLNAWDANKNMDFLFSDYSSDEIHSDNISVVKANLTRRINKTTYTLVIIGKESNTRHPDYKKIGYKNWINFEVARSKDNKNKLVAVKIHRAYDSPDEVKNANAKWAMSFTQSAIIAALDKA